VNVDEDAGREPRQNLEQLKAHVAARAQHVARVDEQDVAGLELLEERRRNRLDRNVEDARAARAVAEHPQQPLRLRLDERRCARTVQKVFDRIDRAGRREAAADLDVPLRRVAP